LRRGRWAPHFFSYGSNSPTQPRARRLPATSLRRSPGSDPR
jgi:hypothetical protein